MWICGNSVSSLLFLSFQSFGELLCLFPFLAIPKPIRCFPFGIEKQKYTIVGNGWEFRKDLDVDMRSWKRKGKGMMIYDGDLYAST